MASIFLHHIPMISSILISVHGDSAKQQGTEIIEDLHDLYALLLVGTTRTKNAPNLKFMREILDLACNSIGIIGKVH